MKMIRFSPIFLAISMIVISVYVIVYAQCQEHAHSHEPPSFKYSEQANKEHPHKQEHGDSSHGAAGHGHTHGEDHGHSHGGASHGHTHGGANHGHTHGGASHGHTHGGASHGHTHGGASHGHTHGGASHGHTHGGAGHGHSHEGVSHGHTHEETSHGHSHGGASHGHTHGGEVHGHSHEGSSRGNSHGAQPENTKAQKNTGFKLWFEAITATAIISISPIFILFFIPLDKSEKQQPLLKILLSFASGGLLGDAFLHLIPHAVSPHSHVGDVHAHSHGEGGHSHDMSVGLWTLAGIVAFLIVEKFVRIVKGNHGHSHLHSHAIETEKKIDKKSSDKSKVEEKDADTKDSDKEITDKKDNVENEDSDKKTTDKKTDKSVINKDVEDIKVAGYLNLAADFAHNFTDGLAIGASFMMGHSLGIITTITIFLHEIPHEIGDFAILVQSGCTKKKAMMLQFSTAIGAMLGTVCSLLAEGIGEAATTWILPFTAGGFIYIATVSVIPELLEDTKLGQSIKEIAALLIGVYMMVLIGQYE